jgi:hypothetical protein
MKNLHLSSKKEIERKYGTQRRPVEARVAIVFMKEQVRVATLTRCS